MAHWKSIVSMQLIPDRSLFVSEPNPYMFGNPSNVVTSDWTNSNWLKSRFHFSFAEYHDSENNNFGPLRVMNDDLVQPSRGFGSHPHANMEIVTYVVSGELTHKDSKGNEETLGKGSIQYMSAGTGLYHSESNESPTNPCRFIQMWIVPRKRNLKVRYGSYNAENSNNISNRWIHMVSDIDGSVETPVKIHQDTNIFVAKIEAGQELEFTVGQGRAAYILNVEAKNCTTVSGSFNNASCSKKTMSQHDALKVFEAGTLKFKASEVGESHVMVVEMSASSL